MQTQASATDVAWAAGLFEGEGCWNIYNRKVRTKSGRRLIMTTTLGMTDRDVVEKFGRIVGCGTVSGPRGPWSTSHPGKKPMFEWRVAEAEKVREIIRMLYPYLGNRRRADADRILEEGASIRSHNAKTTHCPQGHPLSGANLQLEPIQHVGKDGSVNTYMARRCKECRALQARERARRRLGITPDRFRVA